MTVLHSCQRLLLQALSPAGARGRLIVITYHRVPGEPDPLVPSEPDARLFEQQVTQVARLCRVLPLPEAVRALTSGRIPGRAACITFDDGYRNNHSVAAPILRKSGLPATFFVTREAVRGGIMWNDLVIEAVRRAGPAIDLSPLALRNDLVTRDAGPARLADSVLAQIKYLPLEDRWHAAMRLFGSVSSSPAPRLMMTESEVADLAAQGFDVGGHTISHPILAKLDSEQARFEISACATWLRELTGRAPVSFAYPNGRPGRDYGPEHVAMVRTAGFQFAVSTKWACATRQADPLQIPRVGLSDVSDMGQFVHLLKLCLSSYR